MSQEILLTLSKIEEHTKNVHVALVGGDAEAILKATQTLNIYVQELLHKAHKNRVHAKELEAIDAQR